MMLILDRDALMVRKLVRTPSSSMRWVLRILLVGCAFLFINCSARVNRTWITDPSDSRASRLQSMGFTVTIDLTLDQDGTFTYYSTVFKLGRPAAPVFRMRGTYRTFGDFIELVETGEALPSGAFERAGGKLVPVAPMLTRFRLITRT